MTTSKATADDVGNAKCPIIKLEAERLPDMTVPRSGHSAFLANGEVTVVGGHTSGFVLYSRPQQNILRMASGISYKPSIPTTEASLSS